RVDKMRSRAYGGTGLGLAIVSDTVLRRGGTIEAAAREGGGSVFTVCFPRVKTEGGETA
ncbi:MAG: cell wall metabolism sensor histidine kinase WalK, partial [Ruminococcaceae bacterium]|nr:cell wall metabolism sensor histidine kinase WalK [Oscillospiraceae bacterium]